MKTPQMLDLSSKIATQAIRLNQEVLLYTHSSEDEIQKNNVLSSITEMLDLTNDLIDIVGENDLKEYNALFQSWQQGRVP